MFLAHSGVALAAAAGDRRVPMLWLLLAAWAFDITGVGHWVPFAVLLGLVAFEAGRRRWDARVGALLAAVVLSHDVLDLVVGVQLLPGGRYVGWDLGHGSALELVLEVAILVFGSALYLTTLPRGARRDPMVVIGLSALVVTTLVKSVVAPSSDEDADPVVLAFLAVGAIVTSGLLVRADRAALGPSVSAAVSRW